MNAFTITPLQSTVLDEVARRRLTVVRAGPGSGKTRVFVEALRRQLEGWTSTRSGIAALSFTNVAHEVVAKRLGGAPPAPHFIGTIDSFFMRFVLHPFAKVVGVTSDGARLEPPHVLRNLAGASIAYGSEAWQKASIFQFAFCGGDENEPIFDVRDDYGRKFRVVGDDAKRVLEAKKREWGKQGRVSHSDCQYLASRILTSPLADCVVSLVAARFPVILVDEFQDTGWFLGRALLVLLDRVQRGLVVGDPDQAIYQFAGTDRELFDKAERASEAEAMLLNESHRCSQRVASVASALSRSNKQVVPREGASQGQTFLVVYSGKSPEAASVIDAVRTRLSETEHKDLALLSRKGKKTAESRNPWGNGQTPGRISDAVAALRSGDAGKGAQSLARELANVLIRDDAHLTTVLAGAGINARQWSVAVAQLLMKIERRIDGESWNDWIACVRGEVELLANAFSIGATSLGNHLRKTSKGGDEVRDPDRRTTKDELATATVHSVKGQEFAAVILLIDPPHKTHAPCPSTTWWADQDDEREIAYVACSRAETTLCIAVHEKTYQSLLNEQPGFVGLFEVIQLPTPPSDNSVSSGRPASSRSRASSRNIAVAASSGEPTKRANVKGRS